MTRKVKCWIAKGANWMAKGSNKALLLLSHEHYNPNAITFGGCKVHASSHPFRPPHIPLLPEYVIEAYNGGVKEFEIEITIEEPVFTDQGLLKVTYNQPKKQMFSREEVINMIGAIGSLKTRDEIQEWLDETYWMTVISK